ncbi:MAG: cytochrome P450, partial [Myxococcota bacterium]|nr:cytochrome P450 [Myxococcota bacterium]
MMQTTETGIPIREDWDPLGEAYLADPYEISRRLREETPIFFAPSIGYYVVNRMSDVMQVFDDHETFASVLVQDPVFPLDDQVKAVLSRGFEPLAVMSNRPEPDHARIRVHTRKGFSNRRLKALAPYIRSRCDELLDQMLQNPGPAEFVKALAFPLPGETVFRLIGFPPDDDEMLKSWCGDRKAFSWGRPSVSQQVGVAEHMLAYWEYCREFTARKREERGDDFASELLAAWENDPEDLTYHEVESIVYGLSFAGHEAVTNLICNALLCLLPRRAAWGEIVADPSLIRNAVEEILRFESSQISWRRITTRPAEIGDWKLPVDAKIFLNFAAANRDTSLFDDPDEFDIHRSNANQHISFGKGVHFCLGPHLARLEVAIVLEALAERVPSIRLVGDQDLRFFPNITFRGPEELQVEWDP